eukprot:jgi/Mesen1/7358/ME000381S06595
MAGTFALCVVVAASLASYVLAQPQFPDEASGLPHYHLVATQSVTTGYKSPYGGDEIYGLNVGKNTIGGDIYEYNWTVSWLIMYPDCVARRIVAVNKQYPGPTVRISTGDSVRIHVDNKMPSEGVTMHWHGIRQLGQPWQDGAAYINQCPIQPEASWTYEFSVPEQHGTFWYHSHLGLEKGAGSLGLFIVDPVEPPPFQVGQDLPFLISDWLHIDETYNAATLALSANSLLLNGRGFYPCKEGASNLDSYTDCRPNNYACGNTTMRVKPGKKYLLRVVNTGSGEYIVVQFQSHNLTVVLADGGYTKQIVVDKLYVAPGQAYGVILKTNQKPYAYWIALTTVFSPTPTCYLSTKTDQCPKLVATLFYMNSPVGKFVGEPPFNSPFTQYYDALEPVIAFDKSIQMHKKYIEPLPAITRTIKLGQAAGWDGFVPIFDLNRIQGISAPTPVLHAQYFGVDLETDTTAKDDYDPADPFTYSIVGKNGTKGTPIYDIKKDDGVFIIFQNSMINVTNFPDPMITSDPKVNYTGLYASLLVTSISHSWHLHGHDFWVLGEGLGIYNNATDFPKLNTKNPIKRNVTPQVPLGWTAILWKADNPGAWIAHCHFDQHLAAGMFVVFMVDKENIPPPPTNLDMCGKVKNYKVPGVTYLDAPAKV